MNLTFFKFVRRIESIAAADPGNSGFSSMEIPKDAFRFSGAFSSQDMTMVRLASSCLLAVADKPAVVISIDDIELVHFERVYHGGKSFDMVVVFKEGVAEKGQAEYTRITGIEMRHLEDIKNWLDSVAEVIFSETIDSFKWDHLIADKVRRPDFWLEEDEETGGRKHAGVTGLLHDVDEDNEEAGDEDEEDDESEAYESDDDDDDE